MEIPEIFYSRFSQLASDNEIPSFSMIFQKENLVGEAMNLVQTQKDISAHSEILAIQQAQQTLDSRYLTKCTLFTTLEPCTMCAGAIILSRIETVVYLAPAAKYDGISSLSLETLYHKNHFPKLVLANDQMVSAKLKTFFRNKR